MSACYFTKIANIFKNTNTNVPKLVKYKVNERLRSFTHHK